MPLNIRPIAIELEQGAFTFSGVVLSPNALTPRIITSGNLFEVQNATRNILASFKDSESTTFFQINQAAGTNVFNVDNTNRRVGIRIASPAVDFDIFGNVRIQSEVDSITAVQILDAGGGTPIFNVDTVNERVGFGIASPLGLVHLVGSEDVVQQILVRNSTQTANIVEWQESDTTVLGSISGAIDKLTLNAKPVIFVPDQTLFPGSLFFGGGGTVLSAVGGGDNGQFNIGIGLNALTGVTTGANNMAMGQGALLNLSTGDGNIAMGVLALTLNATGKNNTSVGGGAMRSNIGGSRNTAIGFEALKGTTGNFNTGIGYDAGRTNTTGTNSLYLGYQAGWWQTATRVLVMDSHGKRANAAEELTNAILYGVMAATPASQTLRINASLFVSQLLITSGAVAQPNASNLQIEGAWTFKETTAPTADAGYGKIWTETNNELFFQSGNGLTHLLHGDAFSNIWFHGISTVEVTISTQNALTSIDSFTVVGNEDDLANVVGSVSNNNLVLSSTAGGEYEVSFHASITATGGADKEMLVCMGITLATPKDITNVTDDTITPIVITSVAHGLENGDMVEIAGVLGNTAANGSFMVDSKADDTFVIVKLDGTATVGNGNFDEGSPTGDVTILYVGNMIVHREVRGATLGSISATGLHVLSNNDKIAVYVANLDGTTNLTVAAISFDAFRIGD